MVEKSSKREPMPVESMEIYRDHAFPQAAERMVGQYESQQRFDLKYAGEMMRTLAHCARGLGQNAQMSPDFVDMIADYLLGDAKRGKGPPPQFASQIRRDIVRQEFDVMRKAGEKYEYVVQVLSEKHSVDRKTIENWLALRKSGNS